MRRTFLAFALRYGSRSLWRNKRRTLLTMGTVALSVSVSIIAFRYAAAIMQIWEEGTIDHGTGHAQLHTRAYQNHPDALTEATTLSHGHAFEQRLAADPRVQAISRRLIFEGLISSGLKSIYFFGKAVDPTAEGLVSPGLFHPGVDQGRFVTKTTAGGIVVGRGLAEALDLKIGDEVTLMAHTLAGAVNGIDAVVQGIIDLPVPSLSKRLLYMHLAAGQKALEVAGRYSELAIRLRPGVDAQRWVAEHREAAGTLDYELKGWWDIEPIVRRIETIWNAVVGVICGLLFLSAALSILNIVFLLVVERTTEIGTLMAIGARPAQIRTLFTLEAAFIGLSGGAAGAALGNAALLVMDLIGVPFESPFTSGFFTVHPKPDLLLSLAVGLIAVAICHVSALLPARRAARVEPVTAFRGHLT